MRRVFLTIVAATFYLFTRASLAQTAAAKPEAPSTVQPGAPGQGTKAYTGKATAMEPTKADVDFMQGMIMHHSQAVEMTALLKVRSHNPELLELGKRIEISQTDEIGFMKRWLIERGKPISSMPPMDDMPGMDMSAMMPAMPGMLTPAQMAALRKATGPEFDRLFLTGMIQHHTGALTMVKQLFATPGAAQDAWLFDFTSDVDNTQMAEIQIMKHMLAKEKQ